MKWNLSVFFFSLPEALLAHIHEERLSKILSSWANWQFLSKDKWVYWPLVLFTYLWIGILSSRSRLLVQLQGRALMECKWGYCMERWIQHWVLHVGMVETQWIWRRYNLAVRWLVIYINILLSHDFHSLFNKPVTICALCSFTYMTFLRIAVVWYNWHAMQLTYLKCAIQCVFSIATGMC